jgi:hypothetical protein
MIDGSRVTIIAESMSVMRDIASQPQPLDDFSSNHVEFAICFDHHTSIVLFFPMAERHDFSCRITRKTS